MPEIDIIVETPVSNSIRAEQVSCMFDVPPRDKARLEWRGNLPIEERKWNVGLIVGPSGCGKSTILNKIFGPAPHLQWGAPSVIDDFAKSSSVKDIAGICQAVGFNTIPAWLRPFGVLSNGEQFRVELARRLLEGGDQIAVDEFTSVVDRQVAKTGSHAVQKWMRKHDRQFVAATCHFDLEDWLQPDWVLEPATMQFRWRAVQRRPPIECTIARVPYAAWALFARYHYLTADLNQAAACYLLSVAGEPAAFIAVLYRVHPHTNNVYGISRTVTLPDWQGLGLSFVLSDTVASAYKAQGKRFRRNPAHPSLIRACDRSRVWALMKRPGLTNNKNRGGIIGAAGSSKIEGRAVGFGGRPCAIFEYCGPAMAIDQSKLLVGDLSRSATG